VSNPPFHVPMQWVKRAIIDRARIINLQREDDLSGYFGLSVESAGTVIASVNGRITIVRNTPTPDVFGANVTVRGHYFHVPAGEAIVDYDLILLQVDENSFIGRRSIHIHGFNPIHIGNMNDFVTQVEERILNEWH
jgi:hypothetical protein